MPSNRIVLLQTYALVRYNPAVYGSAQQMRSSGKESGTVLPEIGYIKGGVDRIERKQDEQDARYITMAERVTAVESSAKQAHKRIDRLEGHENDRFSEAVHNE